MKYGFRGDGVYVVYAASSPREKRGSATIWIRIPMVGSTGNNKGRIKRQELGGEQAWEMAFLCVGLL